jgi:uncharacterized protein YlxP (DUF503 family)
MIIEWISSRIAIKWVKQLDLKSQVIRVLFNVLQFNVILKINQKSEIIIEN